MDEKSKSPTTTVLPEFLINTINELNNFKSNVLLNIDILNDTTQITDIQSFIEKIKSIIENIQVTITDINRKFYEKSKDFKTNFETFKKSCDESNITNQRNNLPSVTSDKDIIHNKNTNRKKDNYSSRSGSDFEEHSNHINSSNFIDKNKIVNKRKNNSNSKSNFDSDSDNSMNEQSIKMNKNNSSDIELISSSASSESDNNTKKKRRLRNRKLASPRTKHKKNLKKNSESHDDNDSNKSSNDHNISETLTTNLNSDYGEKELKNSKPSNKKNSKSKKKLVVSSESSESDNNTTTDSVTKSLDKNNMSQILNVNGSNSESMKKINNSQKISNTEEILLEKSQQKENSNADTEKELKEFNKNSKSVDLMEIKKSENNNSVKSTLNNYNNTNNNSGSIENIVSDESQKSNNENVNESSKLKMNEHVEDSNFNFNNDLQINSKLNKIKEENCDKNDTKFGLIKCIDITKLLDPKVATQKVGINNFKKNNKIHKHQQNKIDNTIILLSSDSEEEETFKKKKPKENNVNKREQNIRNDSNMKEVKQRNTIIKKQDKNVDESSSGSDSDDEILACKRVTRITTKSSLPKKKSQFDLLKKVRECRNQRGKNMNLISTSESESDTNNSKDVQDVAVALSVANKQNQNNTENHLVTSQLYSKITNKKTNELSINVNYYDYKNDIKFKSACEISLPKISVEKLKEHYLHFKEDEEINRLSNLKTLKRTRRRKNSAAQDSLSSDINLKKNKKRNKLQLNKSSDESQHSNSEPDSDEPINMTSIIEPEKNLNKTMPNNDDLLVSSADEHNDDSNSNKGDEDSDSDEKETREIKKKNKTAEMIEDEGKQKSKWQNDKLLKNINISDSEEELIRFRNKKDKIANDIRSKTKKQLKRLARCLDSDMSSDDDANVEEIPNSSSEFVNKKGEINSSSSHSDTEEEMILKKPVRKRIKRMKDSEESTEDEDNKMKRKKDEEEDQNTRKKIRNVWKKDSLADATIAAAKEEAERRKRISDRQKLYNNIYDKNLNENVKVDKVVLDFNEATKEELLAVHPDLVSKLKPHQANGVRFMWTACFESLKRSKSTEGSGCILAHCMGLGKTLQVITLVHTLLTNTEKTNVRTVLIVCPLSTVLNWVNEFKKWLDDIDTEQVNVFDLVQYKQNYERLYQLQDWMKLGGVMIMGYDMFRNFSKPKGKRTSKKLVNGFNRALLEPGPDLVVCDEGHLLKNEKTGISIAMNKLKTKRRIVLTGTPLQNNLKEYFCMVQFVKPNLLGTYKEYLNGFVNPITNGQYTDSTPRDIYIMRKRAHVLHKMLDAVVERRDYNVLEPFLPPKHEYVLFLTLAPVQIELYKEYLVKYSQSTSAKGTSFLFQDFQALQRICIHPRVLLDKSNLDKLKRDKEYDDDEVGSLKDFIDDDSDKSTSLGNSSSSDVDSDNITNNTRRTRANPGNNDELMAEEEEAPEQEEWWSKHCQNDELDNICHSSKIKLLFAILNQCELIGDKILVFSQSLFSLNLIEYFLARVDEATQNNDTEALKLVGDQPGSWTVGLDYFRLDGSTSCENRSKWCDIFNNEANTRARLFLISTKAGGLGINLFAANRVIIFDVSWNPSYDIQSIYRVYRFGQKKPCYIYRFVTLGTMENKIYERQVTKQAISKRVIDAQQIDRHYNQTDLAELYAFNPIPEEERPIPLVPKDRLFADLLQTHEKDIFKYHEHNSLLENKEDEDLNEEERRAAWEEFENEKKAPPNLSVMQIMMQNGMYETLRIFMLKDNPNWTPMQINNALQMFMQQISQQVSKGDYTTYRQLEVKNDQRIYEQKRMQLQQYMQQIQNTNPMGNQLEELGKFQQMLNSMGTQRFGTASTIPTPSTSVAFPQNNTLLTSALNNFGRPTITQSPYTPASIIGDVIDINDDDD